MDYLHNISGKTFSIMAFKAEWPKHFVGKNYQEHLKIRGATLLKATDLNADYVVIGAGREKGRAAMIRKAEKQGIDVFDEVDFFELIHFKQENDKALKGLKFAFAGGFHLSAAALDEGAACLLEAVGAEHVDDISAADFFVLGDKRAKGKAAAIKKAQQVIDGGKKLQFLSEIAYLDLMREHHTTDKLDFPALVLLLGKVTDPKKVDRAIKMLQGESFELYSNTSNEKIGGVVKSQTGYGLYAPWINHKGQYGCYDEDLEYCMGMQGSVCKHSLLLLLGLARKGELELKQVLRWVAKAELKKSSNNEDESAEMLLRYKGVQTGEVDWRPTEITPEDFYL